MTFNFSNYNKDFVGIKCISTGLFYSAFELRGDRGNFIPDTYHWLEGSFAFGQSTGWFDPTQNAYELISNWQLGEDKKPTSRAVYFPNQNANITIERTDISDNLPVSKVQSAINETLYNNGVIYCNNALCSAVINRCQEQNIDIPAAKIKDVLNLQIRLEDRNEAIARAVKQTTYHTFDNSLDGEIQKMWDNNYNKIGIIITTTVLIISAIVVIAMLSGIIWLLYQKYHPESKVDLKYSDDLTADLLKYLPKDVYDRLMKENKKFQDIANRAIQNQAGLGTIKTIGIAALALIGTPMLIGWWQKQSK